MTDKSEEATGPPNVPAQQDPAGEAMINPVAATTQEVATPAVFTCPSCGKPNEPDEEFCSHCGASLSGTTTAPAIVVPQRELTAEEIEAVKHMTLPPVPIVVAVGGTTHLGNVAKYGKDPVNEDAFVVKKVDYPIHDITVPVAIVADGMGGEAAGEVFSEIAVSEAWAGLRFNLPYFEHQTGFDKTGMLQFTNMQASKLMPVITATNRRVFNTGRAKKLKPGGFGSTIVMATAVCDLTIGHVKVYGYGEGDARCVLVAGNKLTQLSRDQTVLGKPNRYLGKNEGDPGGYLFQHEIWFAEADFQSFWLLLYTDGLWNMLSDEQIVTACHTIEEPRELAETLVNQALEVKIPHGRTLGDDKVQPGDDNVTVAAIRCATR